MGVHGDSLVDNRAFIMGKGQGAKDKKTEDLKKELELDVHKVELDVLCKRFGTNIADGLTTAQAQAGIAEHGLNQLTPPPTTPEWVKFCQNLFSGLLGGAVLSGALNGGSNQGYNPCGRRKRQADDGTNTKFFNFGGSSGCNCGRKK